MKWSQFESDHPVQVENLIESVALNLLEQIQERVTESGAATFDECRRSYDLPQLDRDDILDLSLEDQLQLIERRARRHNVTIPQPPPSALRAHIEDGACQVITRLAEKRAMELFEELEVFMTRHELEVFDMVPDNPLAQLPHQTERPLGNRSIVYGYRAPDGSLAEVFEFRCAGFAFFFERVRR